jgi:hypothetical protein
VFGGQALPLLISKKGFSGSYLKKGSREDSLRDFAMGITPFLFLLSNVILLSLVAPI